MVDTTVLSMIYFPHDEKLLEEQKINSHNFTLNRPI